MQVLTNQVAAVYETFSCSNLLSAEYRRRVSSQSLNTVARRFQSIFCLFVQHKGFEGAKNSAIKIEKYNSVLKTHEEVPEIAIGDRCHFGVILYKNKIYVMGGMRNKIHLKTVSTISQKFERKQVKMNRSMNNYSQMSAYDLDSREEQILPEMNFARRLHASIVVGKYIYVFGGRNISGCTNECER